MKRIYYPYWLWEEWQSGMWRFLHGQDRVRYRSLAADLMRDPQRFKSAMQKAVAEWHYSVEQNLTAKCMNRIAWLGHAGCCIAHGCPEDVTREAWHTLNQEEQDEANRVAGEVLEEWEATYAQGANRN